jgi:biopolymer transport protein ExbD
LANWDVFHGDRLELERGLTTSAVRDALARGELIDDDLVRPAGTTVAWTRLGDMPQLLEPAEPEPAVQTQPEPQAPPMTALPTASSVVEVEESPADSELQWEEAVPERRRVPVQEPTVRANDWVVRPAEPSDVAFPVINDEPLEPKHAPAGSKTAQGPPTPDSGWRWADDGDDDVEEEDDDFVERHDDAGAPDTDGLEILEDDLEPGPADGFEVVDDQGDNPDSSSFALPVSMSGTLPVAGSSGPLEDPGALAELPEEEEFSLSRSGPMTVEELDLAPMVDVAFQLVLFFMVAAQTVLYKTLEIPKPSTDQAPAAVTQGRSRTLDDLQDDYILVEIDSSGTMKLDRQPVAADMTTLVERLRSARETTRRKAMLLSADFGTPHRSAVLAYDAANEIGLGIVIARPASPQGPGPRVLPGQPPAAAAAKTPAATKTAPAAGSVPN